MLRAGCSDAPGAIFLWFLNDVPQLFRRSYLIGTVLLSISGIQSTLQVQGILQLQGDSIVVFRR